ncbi:hypothetical protein [Methanobacterium paludis]|uniref:Uncharacterized protein n=1 Tax=Methanobacterium paludis (strain DSM 25820 / JCM 18151 / SWAN1) TaxID=868131 RepID=F6D654_METPW|nr:hypothetical protein [Methanobacterium paludis]AEG18267.1 hypothetical protein MSWAN_1250 [Methanobacterium paludis]
MKKGIKNIELISTLKSLEIIEKQIETPKNVLKDFKEDIYSYIGQDSETIRKRMDGLKKEDEFLLFSLMLGNILQVTRLEQKRYIENKLIIPDFLFAVKMPEQVDNKKPLMALRFFVEVKKMRKGEDEFIISLKYYEKIKAYAELYSLPLYFAIKMDNEHPAWFLVLSESFEEYGKIQKRKVNGRIDKCFVIKGVELLNYDYSGILLSNYLTLIPAGLKIDMEYDNISKKGYGEVISVKSTYENDFKKVKFNDKNKVLDSIFLKICNYLKACNHIKGGYAEIIDENEKNTKWQNNIDFWILHYHLILSCYLYLRNQCEKDKNPENINNISYYLETFSKFDSTLVLMIRDIINEMEQKNMIKPIKMIPKVIKK